MFERLAIFTVLNIAFVWGVALLIITTPELNNNPHLEAYETHQASYISTTVAYHDQSAWP